MNNIESNKQIVRDFFYFWNERDYESALALFAENLEWWILGNTTVSGSRDKRQMKVASLDEI